MAVFTIIETEEKVQVSDKTRIDLTKSFVSGDTSAPITSVRIQPGKNANQSTISSENNTDWFIDHLFEFTFDIDTTNNKFDFKEGAGSELTATISTANYTVAALAAEIKTALDAAGALTYTVTATGPTDAVVKFTITTTSAFTILGATGTNLTTSILPDIGFIEDVEGEVTYTSAEVETVIKEITASATDGTNTTIITHDILVISKPSDRLFSTDAQLKVLEPSILKWVVRGRSSYKDTHRAAQIEIFAWMDKNGYVDIFNDKFDKTRAVLPEEFKEWSKFLTLRLIFDGISNKEDDIFFKKARQYKGREVFFRDRAVLRIDTDQDGDVEENESIDIRSARVLRR